MTDDEPSTRILNEMKLARPSWIEGGVVSIIPLRANAIQKRPVTQPERPEADMTRKAGYSHPYGPMISGATQGTPGDISGCLQGVPATAQVPFISGPDPV